MPEVEYATGVTAPTEDSAITASQGSIADPDNTPTTTVGTLSWQWSMADTNGGTYTAITSATNAAFTPGDDEVGKFLQVCASFTDSGSNMEERCLQIADAVANINDRPMPTANFISVETTATSANPYVLPSTDFTFEDADKDMLASVTLNRVPNNGTLALNGTALTAVPENPITVAQLNAGALTYYPEPGQQPTDPDDANASYDIIAFGVTDDGSDGTSNMASRTTNQIFIRLVSTAQVATSGRPTIVTNPGNPTAVEAPTYAEDTALFARREGIVEPNGIDLRTLEWEWQSSATMDGTFTAIPGTTGDSFTPGLEYIGLYIRVCVGYMDLHAMPETVTGLCSTAARVRSASDAPIPQNRTINVPVDATMSAPYTFTTTDFQFADEDGDSLVSVQIASLPSAGNLHVDGTAVTLGQIVLAADIGTITFWPTAGQSVQSGYATFTFHITDDGDEPGGTADDNGQPITANTSTRAATITINLAASGQVAASGAPTVSAANGNTHSLNVPMQASTSGITEPNGIDQSTVMWQWQQSPTANGVYTAIAAATAATFTPLQAHLGQYIRVCASFTDDNGTSEGPLCSTPAQITSSTSTNMQERQVALQEQQVVQASAILATAALTNATTAISGAIAAPATDLSLDGTSMMATARTLRQSTDTDGRTAWYHSTTPQWEHHAAWSASDNSRASLLNRLNAMANGDIALNYQPGTSPMRFWARYQSLDINGNKDEMLEYDGSGTGFYLGADRQITGKMRLGLAISTDSADITLDLDGDMMDDEATRSATSFYPYLHIDLGNNNNARVIAGFGSGTLDIKSTANSNSTASADLSWNMLAASISHHRPMKGNLSARFDGSLQLGNTSVDETTFTGGSTLMAADSSTNELSINAELRYQSNNITPFASLAARKLGGDISQSIALDMAFGADLQTSPANLRIAITRQINDTTHQRHSISLDASTRPSASGISASLGSRYDSITGRPQWQSTIGWQRKRFQTSLQASPGDWRLRARLRW